MSCAALVICASCWPPTSRAKLGSGELIARGIRAAGGASLINMPAFTRRMAFRAHRWLRSALIALVPLGVALVVFFAVGALRGGSDADSGASAATAKVAPVSAAQYSEEAPHVFSRSSCTRRRAIAG